MVNEVGMRRQNEHVLSDLIAGHNSMGGVVRFVRANGRM